MSRELDRAIAEALGNDVTLMEEYDYIEWLNGKGICRDLPDYSTDDNAMLELITQLKEKLLFSQRRKFVQYLQEYASQELDFTIHAAELIWFITPDIVSKAAYKALTGNDWEGK